MATLTLRDTGLDITYLDSVNPTTNNSAATLVAIGESNAGSSVWRGIVKPDLSSIPAGSTIIDATLNLVVQNDFSDNSRTMQAYRLSRAWVFNQATWNVYSTGNNWGTAGAANTSTDREATGVGSVSVAASPGTGATISLPITASKLQEMLSGGTFTNNGFLLKMDTETNDGMFYNATSNATSGNRPTFVVNYTLPTSGGAFLFNFI